jgi:uncharacterized membrane protein YdjX (TVP38/TMEM64 family)
MTSSTDVMETKPHAGSNKKQHVGIWRPILLLGLIVVIITAARFFDVGQYLGSLREWIEELGPWGPVIFILLYAVAVVAAIPGSALTLAAGALFGSIIGIAVVSIAATLGAALSFLVARYFARDAVASWLEQKETFKRLDEMTERHGATIVALTRLVPLFPFNLLNYGFGLTRVPFWTYVLWSWLCMLPMTVVFVVGTDAVASAISKGEIPWALVIAVALAVTILAFLVRYARRRLTDSGKES